MDSTDSSPGAQLRAAREALGIQAREISDALNLSPRAIEAIEQDDFSAFSAPVFARGHVQSYAKLVELDPEAVLAALSAAAPVAETDTRRGVAQPNGAQRVTSSNGLPEAGRRIQRLFLELYRKQPLATVVAVVASAALFLVLLQLTVTGIDDRVVTPAVVEPKRGDSIEASAAEDAFAAIADRTNRQRPRTPAIVEDVDSTDGSVEPAAPVAVVQAAPAAAPESFNAAVTAEPVEPELESELETELVAAEVDAELVAAEVDAELVAAELDAEPEDAFQRLGPGDDRLVLSFSADCWVEIHNDAGLEVFGKLGTADSTFRLLGGGPFRILLGYAPGVRLSFNGSEVSLVPHTRNNVARLVVGQ